MRTVFRAALVTVLCLMASATWANDTCPTIPQETNYCTFDNVPNLANWIEDHYADKWKWSCNDHDRCYQTLGKSQLQCDQAWKSDAYDDCGSLDLVCRAAANRAYIELKDQGTPAYDASQLKAKQRSVAHITKIEQGQCVDEPHRQKIYASSLLSYIDGLYAAKRTRPVSDPSHCPRACMSLSALP